MPAFLHRSKWVLASAVFSVVGIVAIAVILWSARGRTSATSLADQPRTESVSFQAGGNRLAGTLTLPGKPGVYPAVVFINGSGASDRTGGGLFPALWQEFTRRGFACLSWDRPGVGSSTGDFEAQSFPNRADEVLAAVASLRGRTDIKRDHVGVWGFSQGATVAPLAASQSNDIAFVIAVSGCQTPAWKQDLYRVEAELRADGFNSTHMKEAVEFAETRMDLMRSGGLFEELDENQRGLLGRPWFEYVQYCDRKRFESGKRMVNFDPAPHWEMVHCPVLAVFGDKDTSCHVEPSVAVIRQGLEKAGNRDLTVKVFANASHRLTAAQTGGRKEAEQQAKSRRAGAAPDFVPGYVTTMADWLAAHR
jgi:pimeloyl-ACP methyl ester carboxylesterase